MTDKKPITEGDLVTIKLNEFQTVSNTYHVLKKLPDACILSHPLAPECLILRPDTDLNNTFPSMQSQIERCLFFAKNNKSHLGYTMASDLEALCFFFVIKKSFSPKQRNDLATICGKIASVILNNNTASAINLIKQNRVLLDEYTNVLYNSMRRVMDSPLSLETRAQRYTVFNCAGFVLAQLGNLDK